MFDRSKILRFVVGMAILTHLPIAVAQQPDPNSPRYKAVVALSDFLTSTGDEAMKRFIDEKISPSLLDAVGREQLVSSLNELRADFSGAELAGALPLGPNSASIRFSNDETISFEMEVDPPYRFVRIESFGRGESPSDAASVCFTPDTTPDPREDPTAEILPAAETQSNTERFLGVLTKSPDATIAKVMGLAHRLRTEGRVVTGVLADSPAHRAGIKAGDVIIQLGDNRLYSRDGLDDFIKTARPGTVPVLYKRAGTRTERTVQLSLTADDLPAPGPGIRWDYAGLGQLDEALAAAESQGKRLMVGVSGSETCCPFSRFEDPDVGGALAGDDVIELAEQYVTLIIRRPHSYWFLKLVSGFDENANFGAIPDGLKLPNDVTLPIPSVYVLDADREPLDHVALLVDASAASHVREMLRKHAGE